jgi:hypothetical protein
MTKSLKSLSLVLAAASMMLGSATGTAHAAGVAAQTTAKVIGVTQTSTRTDPTFGAYIILSVKFDKNISSGCTTNNIASVAMFQTADNAARDQVAELMSGLRQVSLAALMSGRTVTVQTATGCSAVGGLLLDFVTAQ